MRFCECGCGAPAPIAKKTNRAKGHVKGQPLRFIHGHFSKETGAKISAAKRGKPCSPETRQKISKALSGRTDSEGVRAKKKEAALRASASPTWVGEAASYNAIHNRARQTLPMACEHEDATCRGILEVALRHDLPEDLLRTSPRGHRYYVGDLASGYMRLCRSHHRRYDQ